MARLVECVPNFSEGRRPEVVDAIVQAIASVAGVTLLGHELDPDHNRSVLTFAGEPEAVIEAAFRAIAKAAELIDLNQHQGQHPRMGATDVVPFVPIEGVTLDDCAGYARTLAARVGSDLAIPVFLYESAASRPERVNLADVRRGEFEGLREQIGTDAAKRPDFGPDRIHPTAGATAIGARRFLVAFNANLNTGDVRIAKAVAKAVREQSGGLKNVRALGFSIEDGRRAQVSMNLVNTEATPIHRVLALVRDEAARYGATISGCEVVGLTPLHALLDVAEHALQLENFRRDQVLELRLKQPPLTEAVTIASFFDQVAGPTPTPGGGTVAAFSGALAACLPAMVASLSIGKKKYAAHESELRALKTEAEGLRGELLALARADSEAFEAVLEAGRLAQSSPAEVAARATALNQANLEASRVPLTAAQACGKVLRLAGLAARIGNVNAVTDAGAAGLLARAAAEAALLNVEINLKSVAASADKQVVELDVRRLRDALIRDSEECQAAVRSALDVS
ncbi:MAG: glutamate formimidoyltransferase [Candidatus Eisenbacteria bacterium]|uniref:Formimidoyltransferase-cyclodeaminase n=1 Tax=Eiseniibacteriota bacterium TaxID=2212470 RepID=A0A849SEF9_UNCEI|nr:glutamate formimidoyltransferase [Candidatus Eisenbacteria bacterium]